ncbi:MAG TPA: anti-sigma factor [Actinomycetota bacterium]|nr:anti-sigma factor [Actinomycetota bacterium]
MDPADHETVEELMSGYALRALSGDDAVEAERLLSEHVPGCLRCRRTLLAFSDTVADLALAADPVAPPETLLPRLHRSLEPRRARRPIGRWVGIAAGIAFVLVAGGVAVSQGLRAGDLQERNELFAQALRLSQRPDADTAPLTEADATEPAPVSTVSAPDVDHFFLVGSEVPPPPSGSIYGVWLSDGVDAVFAGSFLPMPGVTVVRVPFDRSRFDRVLVTVEISGDVAEEPGQIVWEAVA